MVTEDCCYEQVVYGGPEIGVTAKNDGEGDWLNSWDLLCYTCNQYLKIIPISEGFYYSKLRWVNQMRLLPIKHSQKE